MTVIIIISTAHKLH